MQENEGKMPVHENAKITLEDVKRAWERYDRMKERAEQHDFFDIFMHDIRFTPLYNDLLNNWNERHAQIFVFAVNSYINSYINKMGYGV